MILSQLDRASEEQIRHSREVKARVIGGVELTLGRHLQAGLLSELRIFLSLDTDAPLHGVEGWTQVHGVGHFSASFAMKKSKSVFVLFFFKKIFFSPTSTDLEPLVFLVGSFGN